LRLNAVHDAFKGASDLTIDQMTAMTLLVNEAALNAAKHVFSKGLGSRFDVSLAKDERASPPEHQRRRPGHGAGDRDRSWLVRHGHHGGVATQLGGSLEVGRSGGSLTVEIKTH
jgi:two-component system, sensor histidine kinase PdtaS